MQQQSPVPIPQQGTPVPSTTQLPAASPTTPAPSAPPGTPAQQPVTTVAKVGQAPAPQAAPGQKQNRLTPIEKPAGIDPVVLLNEKENR